MDLSKLKTVNDLNNYEQLSATLQSKPDYRNILLSEKNVDFLYNIAFWEFKYYKKHGCNGAAVTVLYGMLHMPPSKNWSMLGSKLIKIIEKFLQFIIDLLYEDNNWWKFLKIVLDMLENLCLKDNLIKLLVVEKLTKNLLKFVINDKVVINKKILILKCLNKCSYQCGQQVKEYLTEGLKQYFIKLSKYMSTCGHMDMQLKLFETLMSWLLIKNNLKGRSQVASLLFMQNFYSKNTIDMFIQRDFHNFAKEAAEWLNQHNSYTGHVFTFILKKLIVGNTLLIKQPSRLHLNLGAKCLTVPLGQKLLTNCSLPYSEILTVSNDNAESVEFVTGNQLTINIYTIDKPEYLYESTADVIVTENRLIEIQISNRSDIIQVEWALQNLFSGKYKRVDVESTDKLSPTPSGSGYNDFFSQSMEVENTNVNPKTYGIKTMLIKRRKSNSSPEAQRRGKTCIGKENISFPDENNEEDYDVVGDVMMHVSPSVKLKNVTSNCEQNSCLFDASIDTDNSIEELLRDIDENLVNNIIIDALNVKHTEATVQPQVPTSSKIDEGTKELMVSKSTSIDDGSSEVISDTPATGFINIRRKKLLRKKTDIEIINNTPTENCGSVILLNRKRTEKETSNYTTNKGYKENYIINNTPTESSAQVLGDSGSCLPNQKKRTEKEIDKESIKYTTNKGYKENYNINNTPTENNKQVLGGSGSCISKQNKRTAMSIDRQANKDITKDVKSITRKKRKLYSPRDHAEIYNEIAVEDVECESNAPIDYVSMVDPFDKLRMMPYYDNDMLSSKNFREEDVTSNHSMKLRPRSTKVYSFSSPDSEDDIVINNKFATRIIRKSTKGSLKAVKKRAKKPKTTVTKPRQTKKTPKAKTKKMYTLVDEIVRKSRNEVLDTSITNVRNNYELIEPAPKLRHIYPKENIVNKEDLNNSFASLKSLNIEVEESNINNRSSDTFVNNIKKNLMTTDTKASKTLLERYDAQQIRPVQEDHCEDIDFIEFTSSPKKPDESDSNKQKFVKHDIDPITSKSQDEIVPLEQVQYSKPNDHTSGQDFQTRKVKSQSQKSKKGKTKQKTVAKIQKENQDKNDSGFKPVQESKNNDTRSSEDFEIKKPIIKLQRLKICKEQVSNKAAAKIKGQPQKKNVTNKAVTKKQTKPQKKDDNILINKSMQESNKEVTKKQKKPQKKDDNILINKSMQESNKEVTKKQKKPQKKDDNILINKSMQESNISFNDSTYNERTQLLKLQRLKNVDIKKHIKNNSEQINTTECIDENDVTLTQFTENSQCIRKSTRILERSRRSKENASFMSESIQSNLSWNAFLDPDMQFINTDGDQLSRSLNASTPNIYFTRSRSKGSGHSTQEQPSTSILKENENISAKSILVKTNLLPIYDKAGLTTQSLIRSEPSQEEMAIKDPTEIFHISELSRTKDPRETLMKAMNIMKKQDQKFLLDVGKDTQLLLENFLMEFEKLKNLTMETLKSSILDLLEKRNDTYNKMEETLKNMTEKKKVQRKNR